MSFIKVIRVAKLVDASKKFRNNNSQSYSFRNQTSSIVAQDKGRRKILIDGQREILDKMVALSLKYHTDGDAQNNVHAALESEESGRKSHSSRRSSIESNEYEVLPRTANSNKLPTQRNSVNVNMFMNNNLRKRLEDYNLNTEENVLVPTKVNVDRQDSKNNQERNDENSPQNMDIVQTEETKREKVLTINNNAAILLDVIPPKNKERRSTLQSNLTKFFIQNTQSKKKRGTSYLQKKETAVMPVEVTTVKDIGMHQPRLSLLKPTDTEPSERPTLKKKGPPMRSQMSIMPAALKNLKMYDENIPINQIADQDGNSLMHKAIIYNQYEVVRYLLVNYPSLVSIKNCYGIYPIHL